MHMRSILSVCGFAAALTTVSAVPKYAKLIPNGSGVAGVTAVGHTDPDAGGGLNAFGKAFAAAGNAWTEALCKADSDGDGQTNGEELGDPCCAWKAGATPAVAAGAKDPGSATSKLDDAALTAARALCKAATPGTVKPADGASNATPALTPGAPAASAAPGAPAAAPSAAPGAPAAAPAPAGAAATPAPAGAATSGSDGYDWVPIDQVNKTKSSTSVTTPSASSSATVPSANASKNSTSSASPLSSQRSLMQVVAAAVVGVVALAL